MARKTAAKAAIYESANIECATARDMRWLKGMMARCPHVAKWDGENLVVGDHARFAQWLEAAGGKVIEEERIPPCAASMGCLCAGHSRGNDADAACDTRE